MSCKGFTLTEAAAALVILAFICSGVFVAINRSMDSAADVTLQMQAFEVARENMEELISTDSVNEYTDFGYSEEYPQIQWQTTVESFYEPITDRLWIQAVCTAEYTDSNGELKKVELTHWLTDLTKRQIIELLGEKRKQQDYLDLIDQLIETVEGAAEYAGVDEETVEQWAENGMPVTEDGYFIREYIDLYKSTNGNPPANRIERVEEELNEILSGVRSPDDTSAPDMPNKEPGTEGQQPGPKVDCSGLSLCERFMCKFHNDQLDDITMDEVMQFINECLR